MFPLEQTHHVGVAKSEHHRLTNGEIIFEEFQPMGSQSTNVTDRRTDGRTDRQTTCDGNTALCTKVHRAVKKLTTGSRQSADTFTLPTLGKKMDSLRDLCESSCTNNMPNDCSTAQHYFSLYTDRYIPC